MASSNALPGANSRLQIINLTNKLEFSRWLDSVVMLSQALGVKELLRDDTLVVGKIEKKLLPQYSQLVMAMMNSLSPTLYDVVKADNKDIDELIPSEIVSRLQINFKPKYIYGDLQLRRELYKVKCTDYENFSEYIAKVKKISKEINEIEDQKKDLGITPSYLDDRQKIGIITRLLPSVDYGIQVDKIENDLKCTFDGAVELIRAQEEKLRTGTETDSSSSSSTSINNMNTDSKGGKRKKKCRQCKNYLPKDHKFRSCDKCYKKWKDQKGKKKGKKELSLEARRKGIGRRTCLI